MEQNIASSSFVKLLMFGDSIPTFFYLTILEQWISIGTSKSSFGPIASTITSNINFSTGAILG